MPTKNDRMIDEWSIVLARYHGFTNDIGDFKLALRPRINLETDTAPAILVLIRFGDTHQMLVLISSHPYKVTVFYFSHGMPGLYHIISLLSIWRGRKNKVEDIPLSTLAFLGLLKDIYCYIYEYMLTQQFRVGDPVRRDIVLIRNDYL